MAVKQQINRITSFAKSIPEDAAIASDESQFANLKLSLSPLLNRVHVHNLKVTPPLNSRIIFEPTHCMASYDERQIKSQALNTSTV